MLCVFSQWGEIEDINLVRDEATGKSKGFAFVKYEDQRSTILAVDNFNGITLLGRQLRVDHVSRYKLPKHLQDKEDAANEKAAADLGHYGPSGEDKDTAKYVAGHAYKGKELASGFDISKGVDLYAVPAKDDGASRSDGSSDGSGSDGSGGEEDGEPAVRKRKKEKKDKKEKKGKKEKKEKKGKKEKKEKKYKKEPLARGGEGGGDDRDAEQWERAPLPPPPWVGGSFSSGGGGREGGGGGDDFSAAAGGGDVGGDDSWRGRFATSGGGGGGRGGRGGKSGGSSTRGGFGKGSGGKGAKLSGQGGYGGGKGAGGGASYGGMSRMR